MQLSEWIATTKITMRGLAARLGVSHSQVSRWASGKQQPELAMAVEIERATGGAVRPTDLVRKPEDRP